MTNPVFVIMVTVSNKTLYPFAWISRLKIFTKKIFILRTTQSS
jgi:hypothetical protein